MLFNAFLQYTGIDKPHVTIVNIQILLVKHNIIRAATAGKAGKVWSLPRFWVSMRSYKKQLVKKIWGKVLDLAWLKFAVAALLVLT